MQAVEALDHLVYAVPDLNEAVERLGSMLGVSPVGGGRHEGRGTHNALLGLGGGRYLEVIAPDPSQPPPERPRAFGMDQLTAPKLVTWAMKSPDIDERVRKARASGFDPGEVVAMGRRRPDGVELRWRLTMAGEGEHGGLVPFLIDWGDTPHPSGSAPAGCTLVSLRGEHPDPKRVGRLLAAVEVELAITNARLPGLVATLETPRGQVELG